MKRLLALGVLTLALCLVSAGSAEADSPGQPQPVRAQPARAGGPELAMVVGALGTLGASTIGAGLYLLRRRNDD